MGVRSVYMRTVWLQKGLKSNGKIIIYQDNTSAIWLTANEGNFVKNRHIKIRRNYVKEDVIKGEVLVLYQRSEDMVADVGTKPVTSTLLNKYMDRLNTVRLKTQIN